MEIPMGLSSFCLQLGSQKLRGYYSFNNTFEYVLQNVFSDQKMQSIALDISIYQKRCTFGCSVRSKYGLARIFYKSERKSNQMGTVK